MMIWWIAVPALLGLLIWVVAGGRGRSDPSDSAEQILKRRYAGGDIDHDTFERMLADLKR
jgi:uncharacterized membrane protein